MGNATLAAFTAKLKSKTKTVKESLQEGVAKLGEKAAALASSKPKGILTIRYSDDRKVVIDDQFTTFKSVLSYINGLEDVELITDITWDAP